MYVSSSQIMLKCSVFRGPLRVMVPRGLSSVKKLAEACFYTFWNLEGWTCVMRTVNYVKIIEMMCLCNQYFYGLGLSAVLFFSCSSSLTCTSSCALNHHLQMSYKIIFGLYCLYRADNLKSPWGHWGVVGLRWTMAKGAYHFTTDNGCMHGDERPFSITVEHCSYVTLLAVWRLAGQDQESHKCKWKEWLPIHSHLGTLSLVDREIINKKPGKKSNNWGQSNNNSYPWVTIIFFLKMLIYICLNMSQDFVYTVTVCCSWVGKLD